MRLRAGIVVAVTFEKIDNAPYGKTAAEGKAPSPIPRQPSENFCVGMDDGRPVVNYGAPAPFSGRITQLKSIDKSEVRGQK